MKYMKHLPWAVVAVMGLYVAVMALPPGAKTKEMDLYNFGKIPAQHNGRVQPLDSVARNTLVLATGGRQEYDVRVEGRLKTFPAVQWLLEVMAKPDAATALAVYRIDDPDLRSWLGLPNKPGSYRYAIDEISPAKRQELVVRGLQLRTKKAEARTEFDASLQVYWSHVESQVALGRLQGPGLIPVKESPDEKWLTLAEVNGRVAKEVIDEARRTADAMFKNEMAEQAARYAAARRARTPEEYQDWEDEQQQRLLQEAAAPLVTAARLAAYPQAAAFIDILHAYQVNDVEGFNEAVAKYQTAYVADAKKMDPSDAGKAASEAWMNHFEPFYVCMALYVIVWVLVKASWLAPQDVPLRRTAFYLACLTLGVHTLALILRMFIGSRPPVTNLYSSAIFIGWGGLVLCLIMEAIYKNGLGTWVGALLGFGTLRIAHLLSQGGDTLEMLQAVLDTNFWLSTHVTIVTLGYTATFVAGALGVAFIFAGMFSNALRPDKGRELYQMTYGTLCFATLLSFVGTVLGGIWADQSWGRFWGWDPKENGAVLIVIWNVLALHARWAGLVTARGFAVLAVFGIAVTAWSWFGTNQLGIGLHAYGFNKELATTCAVIWVLSVCVMALGMVPLKWWASFGDEPQKATR